MLILEFKNKQLLSETGFKGNLVEANLKSLNGHILKITKIFAAIKRTSNKGNVTYMAQGHKMSSRSKVKERRAKRLNFVLKLLKYYDSIGQLATFVLRYRKITGNSLPNDIKELGSFAEYGFWSEFQKSALTILGNSDFEKPAPEKGIARATLSKVAAAIFPAALKQVGFDKDNPIEADLPKRGYGYFLLKRTSLFTEKELTQTEISELLTLIKLSLNTSSKRKDSFLKGNPMGFTYRRDYKSIYALAERESYRKFLTFLGQFNFKRDGSNVIITDRYDFNDIKTAMKYHTDDFAFIKKKVFDLAGEALSGKATERSVARHFANLFSLLEGYKGYPIKLVIPWNI
tara:strand:+ start:334 stop:1368 length:1035 start_codon:yes stop_codon:yes gene_type:complete